MAKNHINWNLSLLIIISVRREEDISSEFSLLHLTHGPNCQALSRVSLSNLEFCQNQQKLKLRRNLKIYFGFVV